MITDFLKKPVGLLAIKVILFSSASPVLGRLLSKLKSVNYLCLNLLNFTFHPVLVTMIEMKYVLHIWNLENHHNDPFDRLLIAQSLVENLPIITVDQKISLYNVDVIW
jgi:PIN domain nuclease of toxin-antitoxin system